jgi:Sortase domain
VLVGHIDSAEGVGAFAALLEVAPGGRVQLIDTFGGSHEYRVAARRRSPKYALPGDVFQVRGTARLVLLTCGGPFDERAGRYRDNVVVYAVPSGSSRLS